MLNLSMSQSDLTRVLPLAWQNYLDNQPQLAGYKARYTPELAAAALGRFEAALLLPDAQARKADPELPCKLPRKVSQSKLERSSNFSLLLFLTVYEKKSF